MEISEFDRPEVEQDETAFAVVAARDDAPEAVMTPDVALEKLRRGETVENVRIERLCFQGEFPLPVKLRAVVLVQPQFAGATFREEVVFAGCVVDRPRFLKRCELSKSWTLSGSTLIKAHLSLLTVRGGFFGNLVQTRGSLLVSRSVFEGPVTFWDARLRGWVDFKGCEFQRDVDFRSLHAEEGFVLTRCRFAGNVLFRGATVEKKWEAKASRFEALLDLSKAKLRDFAYLEEIEQGPAQRFAFTNALADRVLIRPEQLAGRLASEESGDYAQAMQEYGQLKRAFQALHRYEQEDWAFYRFKVNQRRCCRRSWLRPWTKLAQLADWLLLDWGCGYGTNPFRAVRTALVIMLGFGLIYMIGIKDLYVDATKLPFSDQSVESLPNRVLIGLMMSVSVFTSGFSGLRDLAHGWMNVPLIIESMLGMLLWGLFIVAFSRKVIR
jgi:hypothetical protein